MKKILKLMMIALLISGISAVAGEKKNKMSTRDVITILKEIGPDHFPEKMKVSTVGSLEIGDTYYHAFCGTTKKDGYRVIFMDNKGGYLGYYATEFEPYDYEEKSVMLDSGETNSDGDATPYYLSLGSKGPNKKISINGIQSNFVLNPKTDPKAIAAAEKATAATAAATTEPSLDATEIEADTATPSGQPEYRQWTITRGGKEIPVKAVYVKTEKGKVYLKSAGNGQTVPFAFRELSSEDQDYLRKLLKK
jgi:hypothetical protein